MNVRTSIHLKFSDEPGFTDYRRDDGGPYTVVQPSGLPAGSVDLYADAPVSFRNLARVLELAADRWDELLEQQAQAPAPARCCANCGDHPSTLSSRDWCDGCEAAEARVLTA